MPKQATSLRSLYTGLMNNCRMVKLLKDLEAILIILKALNKNLILIYYSEIHFRIVDFNQENSIS